MAETMNDDVAVKFSRIILYVLFFTPSPYGFAVDDFTFSIWEHTPQGLVVTGRVGGDRGKLERVTFVAADGTETVKYRIRGAFRDPARIVDLPLSIAGEVREMDMYDAKFRDGIGGFGIRREDGNVQLAHYNGPGLILGPDGSQKIQPLFSYAPAKAMGRASHAVTAPIAEPVGLPPDWFNRVAVDAGSGPARVMLLDVRNDGKFKRARILAPAVFKAAQTSSEPIAPENVLDTSTERLIYLVDADQVKLADSNANRVEDLNLKFGNPYVEKRYAATMDSLKLGDLPSQWQDPTNSPEREIARRRASLSDSPVPPSAPATLAKPKRKLDALIRFYELCRGILRI